jgi:6-pyruvoyltetrahydropterin/6-carboxytetrahydropterin synthase
MAWIIDKTFHLEYGHRVWSQELKADFCASGDTQCACRHPHGHSGTVRIFLRGDALERGMVTDFKHLGFIKNFIDDTLDHKFIVDIKDPGLERLTHIKLNQKDFSYTYISEKGVQSTGQLQKVVLDKHLCGYNLDPSQLQNLELHEIEILEGYFIVHFLPTSENLAKYLLDVAQSKLKAINVKVFQVEWNETAKSRAVYLAD